MNSNWIECVRWCHRTEPPEWVDEMVELLMDHCRRSRYSQPICARSHRSGKLRAEGYAILYPGALASLGNLSVEPDDNDERHFQLLVGVVQQLFQDASTQGAELVQAISPLIASRLANDHDPGFVSPDPWRDEVLRISGMLPVAKLVQMEAIHPESIPRSAPSSSSSEGGALSFYQHDSLATHRWHALIESTYVATRDVPELNGLRRIDNTLEGYAANTHGIPDCWWVVQCSGLNIGCLLLTRTTHESCELTYCGLTPPWRGKGLSKAMMDFVRDWAISNEIQRITLAVDLRNIPAIRLYRSCGFTTQGFVQAWIMPLPSNVASGNPC